MFLKRYIGRREEGGICAVNAGRDPRGIAQLARYHVQLLRKAQIAKERRNARRVAQAARALRTVRRSVERWDVPKLNAPDLADLLKAPYRASRKAMRKVGKAKRATDLHRWRKRIKTIWYQLRLLEGRAPALRTLLQRLERLETALGEHHNLVVLHEGDDWQRATEASRRLTVLTRRLQTTLRRRALSQGRRLLEARPKSFVRALARALSGSSQQSASTVRELAPAAA